MAEPSWVYAEQKGKDAYDNLALIEKKIIHKKLRRDKIA